MRLLDRYAVAAGGGHNLRLDLGAMVLLKENDIAAEGGVTAAIDNVRNHMASEGRTMAIEVEVVTIAQAREALRAGQHGSPPSPRTGPRFRHQAGGLGHDHPGQPAPSRKPASTPSPSAR